MRSESKDVRRGHRYIKDGIRTLQFARYSAIALIGNVGVADHPGSNRRWHFGALGVTHQLEAPGSRPPLGANLSTNTPAPRERRDSGRSLASERTEAFAARLATHRLLRYTQFVGNLEHIWYNVSGDCSQVLVAFAADITSQGYLLVFNNDVDAGGCLPEVP